MQIQAYLNFDGKCEEAFKFYEQVFGGKIEAMFRFADTPVADHVPAKSQNRIMHARLNVGDAVLLGSDAPTDQVEKPQGFAVALQFEDAAQTEKVFNALSDGGTVQMPIQETFWSVRFGMLTDKYDIPWMVNCAKPE